MTSADPLEKKLNRNIFFLKSKKAWNWPANTHTVRWQLFLVDPKWLLQNNTLMGSVWRALGLRVDCGRWWWISLLQRERALPLAKPFSRWRWHPRSKLGSHDDSRKQQQIRGQAFFLLLLLLQNGPLLLSSSVVVFSWKRTVSAPPDVELLFHDLSNSCHRRYNSGWQEDDSGPAHWATVVISYLSGGLQEEVQTVETAQNLHLTAQCFNCNSKLERIINTVLPFRESVSSCSYHPLDQINFYIRLR